MSDTDSGVGLMLIGAVMFHWWTVPGLLLFMTGFVVTMRAIG